MPTPTPPPRSSGRAFNLPTESPTPPPGTYTGRWVVISGIRDLLHRGERTVEGKMRDIVADGALGIVFGGADGVDTVALNAAKMECASRAVRPHLLVVVPGYVAQQPVAARIAIRACADEVIEIGLPLSQPASFKTRNQRMLREGILRTPPDREAILVAFRAEDRTVTGGTVMTIGLAYGLGVEVECHYVPITAGGKD